MPRAKALGSFDVNKGEFTASTGPSVALLAPDQAAVRALMARMSELDLKATILTLDGDFKDCRRCGCPIPAHEIQPNPHCKRLFCPLK